MIDTWEEFDNFVENDIKKSNIDSELLSAHLTVLLTKNMVTYRTPTNEIQQLLKQRYNVEYKSSEIENEMLIMWKLEEYEHLKSIIEQEEDYFEGY